LRLAVVTLGPFPLVFTSIKIHSALEVSAVLAKIAYSEGIDADAQAPIFLLLPGVRTRWASRHERPTPARPLLYPELPEDVAGGFHARDFSIVE
jgi:hypothetical protein